METNRNGRIPVLQMPKKMGYSVEPRILLATARLETRVDVVLSILATLVGNTFRHRWSASILLILALDLATYLAFSRPLSAEVVNHQDKVLHALAFSGLFLLGHISLRYDFFPGIERFSKLLVICNWAIWVGYGLFLELIQSILNYRQGTVGDMAANLVGILLGHLLVVVFKLYPGGEPKTHE